MPKEGELIFMRSSCLDAEALSIQLSDLNLSNPPIAKVELTGNMDAKSELVINYAGIKTVLSFRKSKRSKWDSDFVKRRGYAFILAGIKRGCAGAAFGFGFRY